MFVSSASVNVDAYFALLKPHLTGKQDGRVVIGNVEKIVRLWDFNLPKFFEAFHKISVSCSGKKNVFVSCNCSTDAHLKLCKYGQRMLENVEHFVFNFDNAKS